MDSDSSISKVEIPNDDIIVQILARLDGPAYNQALYQDANTINQKFLAPPSFPWSDASKRLPQRLAKSMPRDIDNLDVITHCQDELRAPFGDFQGPFGFGRYENGQSRGNYSSNPDDIETNSASTAAAARRSQDPGVIELSTQVPLPSSMDAVVNGNNVDTSVTLAEKWQADLISKDSNNAEMLSHLPYHWKKRDGGLRPYKQQRRFDVDITDNSDMKLAESRSRSSTQIHLATSCARKWKVSMKVGGVSSRSTLFPSTSVIATKSGQIPENTRKVIRPMLCPASFPQSIQSGETVSMDKAKRLDKAGLANRLGSYDCRITDSLSNPKKDSSNKRSKQTEVGRTRIIWSNLIQGDDQPFLPSTRNRVNFNSLLTGQRIDTLKCKRPVEVKVGVRLNGRIIMEEAIEDLPAVTTSSSRKRKISTRNQAENDNGPSLKSVHCPESRTDDEIDTALHNHSIGKTPQERALNRSTSNGSVVYLELGSKAPHPDIDRSDIIATLLKFNQKKSTQKKFKRSASSDTAVSEGTAPTINGGGIHSIKQSNSPQFACVPLEDGLIRTVCLNAGNMSGGAVHRVLREVSDQEESDDEKKCSVCWSDEGEGREGVQECVSCGLLAHSNCCLDKGEFSTPNESSTNGENSSNGQAEQWQCAVCCRYTEMKPRRQPRMPIRFTDGDVGASSSANTEDNTVARNANIPGPKCSLCPHRGGAMSQGPGDSNSQWSHEVCRVWSGPDVTSNDSRSNESSPFSQHFPSGSPLSNVCAICGTGGVGLTRCAARGCFVSFHPMCALLASKCTADDKKGGRAKSVKTRKTRHSDQIADEKKSDVIELDEADKKLCKEYTLQLVQLTRTEADGKDKTSIIPVAFCGIHNPRRDDSVYGSVQ